MSFDWRDYLRLAEDLDKEARASKIGEACLRASISRAYYAAFILSRNYLRNEGEVIPLDRNAHKEVPKRLKKYFGRKVSKALVRLKGDRRKADYDDSVLNLIQTAEKSLILARRIVSNLPA